MYSRFISFVVSTVHVLQIWDKGLRKSNASQTLSLPTTIDSLVVTGDVTLSHGDVIGQLVTLLDRLVTRTGNHSISGTVFISTVGIASAFAASPLGRMHLADIIGIFSQTLAVVETFSPLQNVENELPCYLYSILLMHV